MILEPIQALGNGQFSYSPPPSAVEVEHAVAVTVTGPVFIKFEGPDTVDTVGVLLEPLTKCLPRPIEPSAVVGDLIVSFNPAARSARETFAGAVEGGSSAPAEAASVVWRGESFAFSFREDDEDRPLDANVERRRLRLCNGSFSENLSLAWGEDMAIREGGSAACLKVWSGIYVKGRGYIRKVTTDLDDRSKFR